MKIKDDFYYMNLALIEAKKSYDIDEVPVGCIIVKDNKVIAKAHNIREKTNDVFSHAEVLAIKKACKKLNSWKLDDATLYVTLFPCHECAKLIIQSGIKEIVYMSDKYNGTESDMASKKMLAAAGVKTRMIDEVSLEIK